MSKKSKAASIAPAQPVAANSAPVVLYVAVGPKRGLTGNGGGRYSNEGTMAALAGLENAKTVGLPLEAYRAAAVARGHASFIGYAVKNGWLAIVVAPPVAA
jgi:hypothetical protein